MSAIDNEDLIDYEEEVAVAPSATNGAAATGNGAAATADADQDKKASIHPRRP